jgi:hypothetical protein
MAKKKSATSAAEKQLRAAVKKLQAQLAAAEKSTERWRSKAKDHKAVTAAIKAELVAVRRRLEKAEGTALKWKDRAKKPAPPPLSAVPDPPPPAETIDSSMSSSGTPVDHSWTVTALRAEARSRGLSGYSRMTKAELLAELRG